MTHPKHIEPDVTQADREAAEALAEWAFPEGLRDAAIVDIAEDFACHRTAAEAASRAEVERLRTALSELVEAYVCNVDSCRVGGFYFDPEQEDVVVEARAALTALRGAQ